MLVRLTRPSVVSPKTEPGRIFSLVFVTAVARAVVQSTSERRRASKLYREHPPNGWPELDPAQRPVTMSDYHRARARTSSYEALALQLGASGW